MNLIQNKNEVRDGGSHVSYTFAHLHVLWTAFVTAKYLCYVCRNSHQGDTIHRAPFDITIVPAERTHAQSGHTFNIALTGQHKNVSELRVNVGNTKEVSAFRVNALASYNFLFIFSLLVTYNIFLTRSNIVLTSELVHKYQWFISSFSSSICTNTRHQILTHSTYLYLLIYVH